MLCRNNNGFPIGNGFLNLSKSEEGGIHVIKREAAVINCAGHTNLTCAHAPLRECNEKAVSERSCSNHEDLPILAAFCIWMGNLTTFLMNAHRFVENSGGKEQNICKSTWK